MVAELLYDEFHEGLIFQDSLLQPGRLEAVSEYSSEPPGTLLGLSSSPELQPQAFFSV